jgi:polyhydroxyalkanoate synthesis regulator phasin
MKPEQWTDDLVGYMQSSFETTMNTLGILQNQGEKILNALLDQGVVAQQEGRKVLSEWMSMARKGREDYSKMMRDNLGKFTDFFKTAGSAEKGKGK